MADRFDKFTERARNALTRAHEEAHDLGHQHLDTGHLLLAIIGLGDGLAGRLLDEQSLTHGAIVEQFARDDTPPQYALGGSIGFTDDGKRAVERGVDLARRLRLHFIDAEFLLFGVLVQTDVPAARALAAVGVDAAALAADLEDRLRSLEGSPPSPTTTEAALDLARSSIDQTGRTPVIPNIEARALAVERLTAALAAFDHGRVSGYPRLIADELLRPQLLEVIQAIDEGAATVSEFLERVGEVRHARVTLERLALVFQGADQDELAEVSRKAAAALSIASPML